MKVIYKATDFPILQNRVYNTIEEALNCKRGNMNVVINDDDYIFNLDFDSEKMDYDQEYDNSVPSIFFKSYYSSIINYLCDKYKLDSNSLVLDIGCGKGTFLKQMFSEDKYNGRAIGIDPSYEGDLNPIENKLSFIKEYFNGGHLDDIDRITLVILRHTLEHIPSPTKFLKNIFNVIEECNFKNVPIFIEVPDVEWIFKNKAYWDFFYEHVNYFSKKSLYNTIEATGAKVSSIKNKFGDQYLWAEALVNSEYDIPNYIINKNLQFNYSLDFNKEIINNINNLENVIDASSKLVIWGMASKGIIYSLHLIKNGHEPSLFVDININKQNKYVPIIAKKIISPNELPKDEKLSIICMNPNYINEIYEQCETLKIDFKLFSPDFKQIK
jgi:SAM-dependent methyltransferase